MKNTPNRNYPYPEDNDSPDIPRDIKALAVAVDADMDKVASDSEAEWKLKHCYFRVTRHDAFNFPGDGWHPGVWTITEQDPAGMVTISTHGGYIKAPRDGRMQFNARIGVVVGVSGTRAELFCALVAATSPPSWGGEQARGNIWGASATGYLPGADLGQTFSQSFPVTKDTCYQMQPYCVAPGATKQCLYGPVYTYWEGWYLHG